MNTLKYIATCLLLTGMTVVPMLAQDEGGVVRRRTPGGRDAEKEETGMTQRMKSFYETEEPSAANVEWSRVIYRSIDLTDVTNMALYYPELPNEDGENLFFIIMRLLADGKVPAYEYLDGREMFTEQFAAPPLISAPYEGIQVVFLPSITAAWHNNEPAKSIPCPPYPDIIMLVSIRYFLLWLYL